MVITPGGFDDQWIKIVEKFIQLDSITSIQIPFTDAEKRLMAAIWPVVDVDSFVGGKCSSILSSEKKIELESVTNLRLYRKGYADILWQMFRGRARIVHTDA